jgi:hypothetical protein
MKKFFLYMLPVLFLAACSTEPVKPSTVETTDGTPSTENSTLSLGIEESTALTYENLQLYPIFADESFFEGNELAADVKNLKEGIETKGFYVTEKKPYGRMEDSGAVNSLTIQNKSGETIYLMQGDVVSGGNQDRIIAEDRIIASRVITDVPVYCVEQGRWQYREDEVDQNDAESKHKRKIFAFSGYYNVASSDLRKTVRETKNQQSVWNKVGELTAKNNAGSDTKTYTALEGSKEFTDKRDAYLNFFNSRLAKMDNCIGFVAVSGNDVVGTDVFGHPNLFQKQSEALLHGYITDAITSGSPITVTAKRMARYSKELNKKYATAEKGANTDEMFKHNDVLIHFSELK